ncbi:MAG: haloacid dehalogenase-like hydrolase [Phycisphaerales bacterium]|nr:MAG: haloacid dehalogenase-like hydrolase [Phycisphaerales bacterium]
MSKIIALVLDFDDTLAPDSTSGFLRTLGVDADHFWAGHVQQLLDDDWDPIPAYLWRMIELSNSRPEGDRITRDKLSAWGRQITFFEGVEDLFDTLREEAQRIDPEIAVEFYIISSGIGEVLRTTSIFPQLKDVWACEFHYNERGEIVYPRNVVSFTEKTKYLYRISKGLIGEKWRGKPFAVNERMVPDDYRIPFKKMIVVGDGHTDIPCFALVKRYGGYPFGVYDPEHPGKWSRAFDFVTDQRVVSLHTARYSPGSDLHNALRMAVNRIARQIAED